MDAATQEATEATPSYQLTLEGGGLKVEREVDEAAALQIVAIVMGGGAPIQRPRLGGGAAPAPSTTAAAPAARELSLREYLNEVEAKRNLDKIVAIGAFLESERGYKTFTSTQIKTEFRSAREAVPGNLPRDMAAAVGAGWLAESHDAPNEFYVTDSGHKAIEAKFSADVRKSAKAGRPGRRRKARTSEGES